MDSEEAPPRESRPNRSHLLRFLLMAAAVVAAYYISYGIDKYLLGKPSPAPAGTETAPAAP